MVLFGKFGNKKDSKKILHPKKVLVKGLVRDCQIKNSF